MRRTERERKRLINKQIYRIPNFLQLTLAVVHKVDNLGISCADMSLTDSICISGIFRDDDWWVIRRL